MSRGVTPFDLAPKKVVVTGATGQTGSYMVEWLLEHTNHHIVCAMRCIRSAPGEVVNPRVRRVLMDLNNPQRLLSVIAGERPDYLIHLAAQAVPVDCTKDPVDCWFSNTAALVCLLEAVRKHAPHCRVFSAGSSEQVIPHSLYGVSKRAAGDLVRLYREAHELYAVHGILFTHTSPRQSDTFVARKITKGVARIAHAIKHSRGEFKPIELGNVDAKRDWSHARDIVDGIWRMLNRDHYGEWPCLGFGTELSASQFASRRITDYVLASGEQHTVREFVEEAFRVAGIAGTWIGTQRGGADEQFVCGQRDQKSGFTVPLPLVRINPALYRPLGEGQPVGDAGAARNELGWQSKTPFKELVREMVQADVAALNREVSL